MPYRTEDCLVPRLCTPSAESGDGKTDTGTCIISAMYSSAETSERGDSGSSAESESEINDYPRPATMPRPKRPKAASGAATYGTKYNPEWQSEFSFVSRVDVAIQFTVSFVVCARRTLVVVIKAKQT